MRNAPPMKVSRQVLDIMMDRFPGTSLPRTSHFTALLHAIIIIPPPHSLFPERLGVAFMIDPPYLFQIFWKAISPFVPSDTKAKVQGNCYGAGVILLFATVVAVAADVMTSYMVHRLNL